MAYVAADNQLRACDVCGSSFKPKTKRSTVCSKKCQWVRFRNSKSYKRHKAKQNSKYSSVCELCGVKTLKSKRGTIHDRAPELDHIVPVSKGGEHSYKNTQCSCRACNNSKRDKIKGQLRLC